MTLFYFLCCLILIQNCTAFVVLEQNGFKGLHVFVSPSVSSDDWDEISIGLTDAFKKTSATMYFSAGGRSYFKDYTVILPREWKNPGNVKGFKQYNDLDSEMTIHSPEDSISLYNEFPYVENARVCLANGDMMHFPSNFFTGHNDAGLVDRLMLKTWMTYRYGLFDELGYPQDTKYPAVYCDANGVRTATQCSNVPLVDSQDTFFSIRGSNEEFSSDCDCTQKYPNETLPNCLYIPLDTDVQPDELYSSMMGFYPIERVQTFCDTESTVFNHISTVPNLQNKLCGEKTIIDTMLEHYDFQNGHNKPDFVDNKDPDVSVYQQQTKIVFILDTNGNIKQDTGSMVKSMVSEWMKKFAMFMHVGIIAISGPYQDYQKIYDVQQLTDDNMMDDIVNKIQNIKYTGKGSLNQIYEGLQFSLDTLQEMNSIVVLISDGSENKGHMLDCAEQIKNNNIHIVAVDIGKGGSDKMRQLSQAANHAQGMYFYAGENPLLVHDALSTVARTFSYPTPSQSVKILSSMKKTGTFSIDASLRTVEITFHLLSQMDNEEINTIKLFHDNVPQVLNVDPAQLPKVMKTIDVGKDTIGIWSYDVQCSDCSIGIYITGINSDLNNVIDSDCQVVSTKINGKQHERRILAKPVKNNMPIIGASVTVTLDDGIPIELSDDGETGTDAIKFDGVYTKNLSSDMIEEGVTVQCIVTGDGNTFSHPGFVQWYQTFGDPNARRPLCCGSEVASPENSAVQDQLTGSFTRISVSNYYTVPTN